jgi:hypothetical protein
LMFGVWGWLRVFSGDWVCGKSRCRLQVMLIEYPRKVGVDCSNVMIEGVKD